MNRRNFIKSTCTACAMGIGLAQFFESCSTNKYVSNFNLQANTITLKKNVFVQLKKEKSIEHTFVLVKPESLPFPIAIYKTTTGGYASYFLIIEIYCNTSLVLNKLSLSFFTNLFNSFSSFLSKLFL